MASMPERATIEECALLQGFPKYHKFIGNRTERRRMIGNAVPPPVIKEFFSYLGQVLR